MIARKSPFALLMALVVLAALSAPADKVLFDASQREMAGNADWVIDADAWNNNLPAFGTCPGTTPESNPQQIPTPPQSGIISTTPGTYWTGGISSWAVELVKAGHTVESLPPSGAITYGDSGNPQDLSNYKLFIVPEPQTPFTAVEKTAILNFVNAGGGLFMVADHETSDRDCDNWDSPNIFNDLTGATGTSATGLFGIWFRVDGLDVKGEDWFDDGVDNNVTTDGTDPIIHGPFGDGSGGLGFFGATSMDINPADNPTVKAHVWRTGQAHNNLRVTFATASYGAGRVAAIGDSSPADDNSGDPGDTLYAGWDLAAGGVKNKEIHMNACHWLLNPAPDTTPPAITAGPAAAPSDCTAIVTWTTDEPATSLVDYGPTASYGSSASVPGYATGHSAILSGLTASTLYHYRVSSSDAAGNGPALSSDAMFTTTAASAPTITAGPSITGITGSSAVISWTTSEAATSLVNYGLTAGYGSSASTAGYTATHSVTVTGLTPETLYHYQVSSTDACGNGPVTSTDATFTSGPSSLDLSGWVLKQFNSAFTFTFPPGTLIPSGGYLVLARSATRAQFEAFFPSMPAGTVFLNSNPTGSCANGCLPQVNGGETFELWNGTTMEDGTTIAMSQNNAYQRKNPGDPANNAASWTTVPEASANPGQGVGTQSAAGMVINEMADASDYTKEFVELFYDVSSVPPDATSPAAVADLAAQALTEYQVRLTWTAPGDDGATGTAAAYEVRQSAAAINEGNFAAATILPGPPVPQGGGGSEQMVVGGLAPGTTYHFALKTRDEVPNWSAVSNDASVATLSDLVPPAAITDLRATPLSDTGIRLDWTAVGDDNLVGTASTYDIRRSSSRILSEADFNSATQLSGEPAPGASGTAQQMTVNGLTTDTAYYFAMKVKDDAGVSANWSALSNWAAAVTGPTGGGGAANHLVISQIQVAGGVADDEFIELYNPTSSSVSLSGWSLQYKSNGSGSSWGASPLALSGTVQSHRYFLVTRQTFYDGTVTGDQQTILALAAGGATLALASSTTTYGTACTGASIVDKVAWGTGAGLCPETAAVTAPGNNNSIVRKPGGAQGSGTDTDHNANDFQSQVPSDPHNASSTPATPPSALGNVGNTLYLRTTGSGTELRWATAASASAYRVYRGTAANFMAGVPSPWQTPTATTLNEAAVPPPIYFYVVRATDGTNESAN